MTNNKHHEPLFTIFNKTERSKPKSIILRVSMILITFILSMVIVSIVIKENIFSILKTFYQGATIRPWKLALDSCLLLGFGVAVVPAFKMKYWNMGSNGQVMMGTLVSIIIMFYLGPVALKSKLNNTLILILMFISSVIASVIWAVIPALFKVFFKTNETLFTLMMNYIAGGLVAYTNFVLAKGQKEAQDVTLLNEGGWLPYQVSKNFNSNYLIVCIVILLMTIFIYIYMSKTKHGYEITVVGDSKATARYVGMHTKTIIIRTLILNGVMCGIIGFLYASAINHSMNSNMCGSLGFTAVLIAWLSNFNPLVMALVSFGLAFLTIGTSKISSVYRIGNNDIANVIIGLMFFSILICEFFIRFKVRINLNKFKKKNKDLDNKEENNNIEPDKVVEKVEMEVTK